MNLSIPETTHRVNNKGVSNMKLISKLTAFVIIASFIFIACEDEEKEDDFSATIHASVMFMPMGMMAYTTDSSATMIMGYLWKGDSWSAAEAAGPIDAMGAMFDAAVSVGGTELAGTKEAEFSITEEGTYYLGVFEASGMAYSNAVYTVGYYNTAYADSTSAYNSMMMPSGISVTTGDNDLETMMAMKMGM